MDRRCNFHTHTSRCKHATGTPRDYCLAALEHGLDTLGFSDHAPFPDKRWDTVRMAYAELPQYVADVRACQEEFAGRIEVYAGLECEYVRSLRHFLRDELLLGQGLDYLVAAAHQYPWREYWRNSFSMRQMLPAHLHAYTDYVVEMLGSGLYTTLAHPDVFCVGWRHWDDDAAACSRAICQAAREAGVMLEINAKGFQKTYVFDGGQLRRQYSVRAFWEIAAEEGAEVVVGADAHAPGDIWLCLDDCQALAAACGLQIANERLATLLAKRCGRDEG